MKYLFCLLQSKLAPAIFCLATFVASAQQCVLLQSEISAVHDYENTIVKLSDSLNGHAEQAAFAARFSQGRIHAKAVERLAGQALSIAEDAVRHASEAQYYAEVCGLDAVVSFAIAAESAVIDARDFAEKAYSNAHKAGQARSLGDIRYYMQRSQQAARSARKASQNAVYAALDARAGCHHTKDTAAGQR